MWAQRAAAFLGVVALSFPAGCGSTESGKTVKAYVKKIHAGELDAAYAMVSAEAKKAHPREAWATAMHTDDLGDVQGVSIDGLRKMDPGGTCVYAQLDFASKPDQGPYGHYIFYLVEEGGQVRVRDVLTYDRITGGAVKTGHFDESREPFPCAGKRP